CVSKESNTNAIATSTQVNVQWNSLTFMPAGTYFALLEFASTSQGYMRGPNQAMSPGWCGFNDTWNGGTYSATLQASGPNFTATGSQCPYLSVQMGPATSTY